MSDNYLLDTDVLVSYLRGHVQTVGLIKDLAKTGATFSISVITVVEVEAGVRAGEKPKTRELLDTTEILVLDAPMAILAGSFLRENRSKGITLSLADAMIAATAVARDLSF